jgi:hypothetical protein
VAVVFETDAEKEDVEIVQKRTTALSCAEGVARTFHPLFADCDTRTKTECYGHMPCIDQHDIPERNAQVLLMKNIYNSCHSVLIRLGYPMDGRHNRFLF